MKYSLTDAYPLLNAVFSEPKMSSSVTFLLMTSRSRCVPASGANVIELMRLLATYSASKLSTRVDGSEMATCRASHSGFSFSSSSLSRG